MTRRLRFTSLAQADERLGQLAPWLAAVAQPHKQVRELLAITAFYRGEIDRLTKAGGGKNWVQEVTK